MSSISGCSKLELLELQDCNIDDATTVEVVRGVNSFKRAQWVANDMVREGRAPQRDERLPPLKTLGFTGNNNNFGEDSWKALAHMIKDECCDLTTLNLEGSNNGIDDEAAIWLAVPLQTNNKLETIDLSDNKKSQMKGGRYSTGSCATLPLRRRHTNLIIH